MTQKQKQLLTIFRLDRRHQHHTLHTLRRRLSTDSPTLITSSSSSSASPNVTLDSGSLSLPSPLSSSEITADRSTTLEERIFREFPNLIRSVVELVLGFPRDLHIFRQVELFSRILTPTKTKHYLKSGYSNLPYLTFILNK